MPKQVMMLVLIFGLMATASHAQPPETNVQQQADPAVKSLLLLMDRDQNDKVSRSEFMAFMSAMFNRLDVNKNGELDVNRLTKPVLTNPRVGSKHPGGTGSR